MSPHQVSKISVNADIELVRVQYPSADLIQYGGDTLGVPGPSTVPASATAYPRAP